MLAEVLIFLPSVANFRKNWLMERLAAAQITFAREAAALLDRAVERLPLSGRGRARVARVARTIGALADAESVRAEHVAEALAYRSPRELETR